MKKFFRIFLITLGLILLLLISLPMLFKSKIEDAVKAKINQDIYARVDWTRFSLSLFRGFPDLSVNLHQVSVVGLPPFEGDTLAGLERFEIRVNPFSALKEEVQVKSILVDRPLVNGIVLEDGSANWDITQKPGDEESGDQSQDISDEGQASSFSVALHSFKIVKGRVLYDDQSLGTSASLKELNLDLRGDFAMDQTQLDLRVLIGEVNATYGGVRYLKDAVFGLELIAEADMLEDRYTLRNNEIRLNGLVLGAEGVISLLDEEATDFDLRFFSKETDFRTLLSMVPAIYLKDFEDIETRGKLQLEGSIFGQMKDTLLPDVALKLQVRDGYFAYPDLPKDVSDIQINVLVDYKGKDMDATTVDVQQFHLLLGGNPFDLTLQMDHPISDMHVAGEARGVIDFASLKDVVPLEGIQFEGRLETDLSWDTRMSFIEEEQYERVDLDGSLLMEHVHLKTADLPVPLELSKMQMEFNPRFVDLVALDLNLGSSDLHMDGDLRNFIPYLFDGQTVSGSLNLSSSLLDANELMPDNDSVIAIEKESQADSLISVPPDSLAQPALLKIPANVNFALTLQMEKVLYEDIEVTNIHGKMNVSEGIAYMDELSMHVIGGEARGSGQVDTRGEYTAVDVDVKLKEVDIRSAYSQFVSVERLAPMAKYCRGTANMDIQFHSLLDATFVPLYESIDATGSLFTKVMQIHDLNKFMKLSEMLKNDKFTEIAPDEVEASFKVREGRVIFSPFDMAFESSKMTMSGSHGLDMTLDYLLDMNIAKSDLGKGANDLMNGMALLAAGAGIKIPQSDYVKVKARITGTFNEPRVATDLSANLKSSGETVVETVMETVEERVRVEVEKVEEQVREEAGDQAEKIISGAEAEAERLLEEARKAGEALVQEAEKQGENLIKEAGDNAFKKIAAKRAAQELERQAEKQSEKLLKEAEEQADELIKKARTEAENI
jgi:hypothetical protein